ncbi:MAG: electron transport complex subunit RsxB [Gammaproteobacteria bacterium]|nr:electron transport complex subunit RsxB [Gammaproteobacteria bacterium]
MLTSMLIFAAAALVFGALLGFAAIKFHVEGDPVVDKIDAILPQTQCGQCGYPGCKPYARAIASGEADINQCPPGGEQGVMALADLLGREPGPLIAEPSTGNSDEPMVALIDEETCIGCTKCIQVCPVDAIVGAARHKHTVIEAYCTGCKLCLPPVCPVENCIVMDMVRPTATLWKWPEPLQIPELMRGAGS